MIQWTMDIDYLIATRETVLIKDIESCGGKKLNVIRYDNFFCLIYSGYTLLAYDENLCGEINIKFILQSISDGDNCTGYVILFLALSDACRRMLKQKSYDKMFHQCGHCLWFGALDVIIAENDLGIITKNK